MTKKVQLFVIWTIFCLLSNLQLNANITPERKDKPESVITSVTVFTDRAMVTRTISRKLNRGEHILVFDNLPEAIEQNSIQATGEGNAVLKDVKFKKEFYTMVTDLEKRDLDNKLIVLQDSVVDANDHITNANKEQKMMEEMLDKIMIRISNTGSDKDMQQPEGNPEKWIKLVDYYRVKLEELNKQVRTTERKIRNYNEEISFLKNKINNLGGYQEKSKNIIEVLIDVSRDESDILVNMSYMVNGPGWYPVYDLRVFTDNRKMDITYQAMVQQNTTEDWDNVNIKLSTARPNVSGDQPSLNPWHLGLYTYEPVRVNDYARNKKAAMSQMYNSVPVPEDDISREIKSDTIQTVAASVETGALQIPPLWHRFQRMQQQLKPVPQRRYLQCLVKTPSKVITSCIRLP